MARALVEVDPLEAGMDPPEQWSGVTKYGMTPWEESHPRPLADRLAEEWQIPLFTKWFREQRDRFGF